MEDKQPASEEFVIKEYPRSTRWLEERRIIGVGNLILTNERLVFLHQVVLTDEQIENLRKLSEAPTSRMMDFVLALHKKNFQIPLSSLVLVRTGLFSLLPFPRFCLRVSYISEKKKKIKTVSFMFTISVLRGFFQLEITTVLGWVWIIRRAARAKQTRAS